ncbi:MAG: GAF domain-containing protein [Anaerolineales bacterium]|nr:GAF domain-containing protein [Anaerolineales bacterium]MDW8160980.1 GAF domain-containing protein [Anaerolineales bacterium]
MASSIYTTNNIGDVTQEQSAEIIKERLLSSLVSINRGIALDVGRSLEKTAEMATILAEYTLDAWTSPDRVSMGWAEEETLTRGDQGQWTNGKEDTSSLFIPNFVSITPQVLAEVEKSRRLDLVFESIQKSNPEIAAIYFTSKNEVTRYYPNIGLGGVIPPNFKATQRPWYLAAIQTSIPRSEVVWTTSLDTTGLGMVGTVSKAIYDRGSLIGVVGIDVLVEDILANVEKPLELRGGYNFLIDYQGYALVLPEQAYLDILERQPAEGEFLTNLRDARNEFLTTISEMRKGNSGVQEIDLGERTLLVAYQPVAYADWSLASVVDAAYYLAPITGLQRELRSTTQRFIVTQVLPLSAAVFTLIVFIGLVLSNLITVPVRQLALAAEKLGRNEWNVDIPEDAPGEIGLFARTFRNMADHLKDLISNLEQKVAERTEALHRRATQLQASIEVGRAVASERNLEKLLSMVTHLISERFGFYHVGVFLIDAKGEYAWLKAANSEGGQRMLQRQHRLKVNEQGIVGYVTGTGKARIALDVGEDAVFFNNPDLPFTRSEMALPLIAQGRILGALDIQSEKGGAFTEEDIEVLSGMANLVAIAIQNAELFAETQAALEATRRAYQEMSLKGWIDLIRRTPYPTYLSTHLKKVTRLPRSSSPLVERVLQTNDIQRGDEHEIALPIFVKGNRIGVLRLRRHVHQPPFSDTDIDLFQDIALRIGTALEAARLYQESQKRALREKLVGEITSKIRSSNEPTEILRIAVQELQKALQATKAQVTFFPPKSAKGENGHHEGVE